MIAPLQIEAATISMADSLILMVMALVVFGPRKLPQIGRTVGKLMYEFRKASNDFKFQMEEELRAAEEADRRKREEAERQQQAALNPPVATETAATAESASETTTADDASNPYAGYTEYVKEQEKAEETYPSNETPTVPSIQPPATGAPVPAQWSGDAPITAETVPAETAILDTPALPTVESPLTQHTETAEEPAAATSSETGPVERNG
ncbi:MAG: twin-arginine translocase TatA/TatE family subunit [Terracidiphilus sp.]|nr:twin-arginine translocase TatA/TatE family subunit [Terracidiphilus sp.]